ncbi:hypothetical protein BGZ60DRAFT_530407 [Tricladium varicosporioides]|nr:hypothetical protein BGZ60DRAFT_530407 [Hymenoscyphus varicosporioides]
MEEAEYYITTIGLTKDEIPACRKKDIFNSWSSDGVTIIISPNFSTTVFKMAMKRYKLTLECQKLLNCLSDDTGIFYDFYTWRMRTKYRITQGKMIHCLQSFYMPRYFNNSVSFTKYLYIQICQHLKFKTDNKSGRVRAVTKTGYLDHYVTIWETPWDLKREDRNGARSGTLQCRQCSTRFRIAFQYFENYGMAMLFTRLKNLGSGPEDKEWKKHFLPPRVFHPQDTDLQLYTAEVSSLFEVDENPKVDELWADDNRKKLNPAWHNSLASWEQVYKDNISRQKEKEIHGSP